MSNANEPAFPCEVYHREDGSIDGVQTGSKQGIAIGLTKRELFAAMAMQGIASIAPNDWDAPESAVARLSVSLADALLAELDREEVPGE